MDQIRKEPDVCDHDCHAADSASLCDGSCCKPCPACLERIKAERYDDHERRKCQPADDEARPAPNLGAVNAFEMIPGTGIETVVERELAKIHGKDGK